MDNIRLCLRQSSIARGGGRGEEGGDRGEEDKGWRSGCSQHARAEAEHSPDRIVVIYLQEGARTKLSHYWGVDILDVTPSRPLGPFPFSTMKFTPNNIADLLELGYQDAREALGKSCSVHK